MEEQYRNIELVFPEPSLEIESKFERKTPEGKCLEQCVVSMDDITSLFNDYKVESVELWINGAIKSDGIIKFGISSKGEGGLKLTLQPKSQVIGTSQQP
jgi:hypothetical protein